MTGMYKQTSNFKLLRFVGLVDVVDEVMITNRIRDKLKDELRDEKEQQRENSSQNAKI